MCIRDRDTTYYGLDLYGRRRLGELLRALCRIEGIEWVRLHYAYPTGFPDDVIEAMAEEPKICRYLDIPFQHISDAQLAAMHRRHTKAEALDLIRRLREAVPGIALRTTLLVGYPGETEQDFGELLRFVADIRFERLGVFAYSEEEGTRSARTLRDDVPDPVKRSRVERIMLLQHDIAREANLARVGTLERCLLYTSDPVGDGQPVETIRRTDRKVHPNGGGRKPARGGVVRIRGRRTGRSRKTLPKYPPPCRRIAKYPYLCTKKTNSLSLILVPGMTLRQNGCIGKVENRRKQN